MLRTERMLIRPWTFGDIEDAVRLWGNPQVMEFLGGALVRASVEERLEREVSSQENHGIQYWRATSEDGFVGCCGLKPGNHEGTPVVELGFHFLPESWGKGYATEAARSVVAYAFDNLRISTLFAGHHPQNVASRRVIERLGFVGVGMHFYPPTGLDHPWYKLDNRNRI